MGNESDGDGVVVAFDAQSSSSLGLDINDMVLKLITKTKAIEMDFGPTTVHAAIHPGGYMHKVNGVKKYKPNLLALAHKSLLMEVIDHMCKYKHFT